MAWLLAFAVVGGHLHPGVAGAQVAQGADVAAVPANDGGWVRESWTVRDGLPVNSINQLVQSRDGYLWAATFDGLVRFDGVRFVTFNTGNTPGLPSNRIVTVQELRDGSLLMGTEQLDLVRFDGRRATAFRWSDGSRLDAVRYAQDSAGTIWVAARHGIGMLRGDRVVPVARQAITTVVASIRPSRDGSVFVVDVRGRAWHVSAAGVARELTFVGGAGPGAEPFEVAPVYEDAAGILTLSARGQVWRGRDTLRPLPVPASSPVVRMLNIQRSASTGALWMLGVQDLLRESGGAITRVLSIPPSFSTAAMRDTPDGLWYIVQNRVYREGRLVYTLEPPGAPRGGATISSLLFDREGSIWLGTQSAGLHRLAPSLFRAFGAPEGGGDNIYPIVEGSDGSVWLGTWGNGLTRVLPSRERVTSHGASDGVPQYVQSLLDDGDGRLLLAGDRGVHDCRTEPSVRCTPVAQDGIAQARIFALFRDADGQAWAGTAQGLFRRRDGRWSAVPGGPSAPVRAAARTPDGAIWMGTNGAGLARWHDGRFTMVTTADGLPTNIIRSLYVDGDGWLWVGTEGRGLARVDPRQWPAPRTADVARRIVRIGTADGLYDEMVHQVLEDGAGQLWMSSNRGIFRVAREELLAFADGRAARVTSVAYTERDGLRNREGNGGYFPAGVRARDGRLWFPTQAGAVVVDPRRVARNRVPPPLVVEQVVTRERALPVTGAALTLGPDERDLEIRYTAPSFLEPASQHFRYRLVPYDGDWVDAATRRTAFYTRVPPGRYTFHVMVGDGRGGWRDGEATMTLDLAPRWYETWAARALALLALAGLVIAAARLRNQRLRQRAAELEQQVDARTAELRANQRELAAKADALAELSGARSRMFANLSHEFRTPLTLILGPLQGMLEGRYGPQTDEAREAQTLMQRNAQRLLRLINQILDLARLQGGAMTIERREQELVAFTEGVVRAFGELAARRGVSLALHPAVPSLVCAFDAGHLEKVLLNLLSNALKFTPAGGRVAVSVARDGDAAVIAVRDTGVGIAASELPHVFERFYQADGSNTRRFEGTGIGLALARELVELQGGTIDVASVEGAGSTFTVRLPLDAVATAGAAGPAQHVPAVTADAVVSAELVMPAQAAAVEAGTLTGTELGEDRTTVLVVDDNADVRAFVRSVLGRTYQVLEAEDGHAGLVVAQRELPDMVVADLMMPGMDGLALGRALRDDPLTDVIPLVLLTARAESESQVAGYESGADAYLVKPFAPEVLEACLAGLLAQRRRLRERYASLPTSAAHDAEAARAVDAAPDDGLPGSDAATGGAAVAAQAVGQTALQHRLRSLVLARLQDATLSPASLAEAAGMSYYQLYRALQADADTSPSRFIRMVRTERAAELLRAGEGTVTEVAYAVGFESLSYFSRAFREHFGVSPVAFLAGRGGKPTQ